MKILLIADFGLSKDEKEVLAQAMTTFG
jgi:hypothetical protein